MKTDEIPVLGLSKNRQEAMQFVEKHSDYILKNQGQLPIIRKTIDWGLSRGQGKRSGGMVKGGMCTIMGKVSYDGIDMSSFQELANEKSKAVVFQDVNRCARYAAAYNLGCNHIESMCYAIKPNLSIENLMEKRG
ncbi:hypothetical protein HJ167_19940 [Vibrio parahaemolyticus]|nr:hypothetical protein [Vibrio parahaemolyticus]